MSQSWPRPGPHRSAASPASRRSWSAAAPPGSARSPVSLAASRSWRSAPAWPWDTAIIAREPVGVVAAIAPWNAPYGIMLNKVAYALVAGCTVVMKPSPETPIEAYIIAEAAEAAGLSPGVVNLVPGIARRPTISSTIRASTRSASPARRSPADALLPSAVAALRAVRWSSAANRRRSSATIIRPRMPPICFEHDHGDERPGLRDAQPRDRPAAAPRRDRRRNRREDEADRDRLQRRSRHPTRPAGNEAPARTRRNLYRGGQENRRSRYRRRPPGPSQPRLFHRADPIRQRRQQEPHRPGGNLRPGAEPDPVRRRGRCDSHRQRFLRP